MITEIIARIETVDIGNATRAEIETVLADLARVTGWAESLRARCARRLTVLAGTEPILPERVVAGTSRTSGREAQQLVARSETLALIPTMETALADGEVSTAHVDVLSRAVARLGENERAEFVARSSQLAGIAKVASPEEFDRTVKRLVASLEPDGGISRFEQQRRNTYLKHWTDRTTGMVCLHGEFDPETGLRLIGKLDRMVERLFHTTTPDTCPAGDRKHDHLNALALIALVDGGIVPAETADDGTGSNVTPMDRRAGASVTEICVVVDLDTLQRGLHEHSIVDPGHGVDLPVETIRRIACDAGILPVVLNGDGVALDVGSTKRFATAAQRKALRTMYPTCAIPWCHVRYEHTVPHHLKPWETGGNTDLANLLPLCSQHHHAAHEGGWTVTLDLGPNGTNRILMIRIPNETLKTYTAPRARSA